MKQKLIRALENMKRYNTGVMFRECYGFDPEETYDVLVIAPGWKPTRTIQAPAFRVTELAQHAYFSGFLVEKDGRKAA